jgi:hypothetical protein
VVFLFADIIVNCRQSHLVAVFLLPNHKKKGKIAMEKNKTADSTAGGCPHTGIP